MSNEIMISKKFRSRIQAKILTALFLCFSISTPSHADMRDPTVILDLGLDLFEDKRFQNSETVLLGLTSTSAFRRLDNSQRSLAFAHIAYSKINRGKEKSSLQYIEKAMAATKREFGKRSLRYLNHMETKAFALYWADDRRSATRIGEDMLDILERMGDDYRKEQKEVRSMISQMQKVELEEGDLPLDLSEFYTACESIKQGGFLSKAHSIMSSYKLIFTDIKPEYKKAQYFKNTYLKNARESSKDRRNRLIYVPDDKHLNDWCVIYPQSSHVTKVIISASNDR